MRSQQVPCATEKTKHFYMLDCVRLLLEPLFEQWELKRHALFPFSLARGIIGEAFGEGPHRVIQFPQPPLRRAIGGLEALRLRNGFEVFFVWLIPNGVLGEQHLLIFDGENIPVQPDHGGMASQRLFPIEFPEAKMHIAQAIQAAEKAGGIKVDCCPSLGLEMSQSRVWKWCWRMFLTSDNRSVIIIFYFIEDGVSPDIAL